MKKELAPKAKQNRKNKLDESSYRLHLRLFITGITPNSIRAVSNIKAICAQHLDELEYKLEIIDIYQNAGLAKGENIIVTPTLVRKFPKPELRVVGDLSIAAKVLPLLSVKA